MAHWHRYPYRLSHLLNVDMTSQVNSRALAALFVMNGEKRRTFLVMKERPPLAKYSLKNEESGSKCQI